MNTIHKNKLSAIHNLVIECTDKLSKREGLLLPKELLKAADIQEYEQIIVTRIRKNSAVNRIRTIALSDEHCDTVVACGSIAHFFNSGDLTCIISESYLTAKNLSLYGEDAWPIIDIGFDPETNTNNQYWKIELQYHSKKIMLNENTPDDKIIESRSTIVRQRLSSMVYGLVINKTHPNCLQGSAEIPASVLSDADISQYSSVSVYNASVGGVADTYAVAMPEGIVMTTGAMESFATIGHRVNVATFVLAEHTVTPRFCYTDGTSVKNADAVNE